MLMTPQIATLLAIILGAWILFSIEIIPADVIAIGVLLVLTISGLLPAELAFAGFGSDVVILILGLLILTAALLRTGVVEMTGELILQRVGISPNRLLVTLLVPALLSAFISNTAATALFVPVVIGLAKRTRLQASKMLMPLAFATILASSVTLVATSTNIVVSGLMKQYDMAPLGMFELAPVGIPILLVGLVYMYFLGIRLIPNREQPKGTFDQISTDPFLTEIRLGPKSSLVGKTLGETRLGHDWDMTVLRVSRDDNQIQAPTAELELCEGDTMLVEANKDDIIRMIRRSGIDVMSDVQLADAGLDTDEYRLAEVILLLRSPLIGRTLSNADFRERFGLQVLAINRHGETISRKISQTPLHIGDILLLQGHRSNIAALEADKTFRILGEVEPRRLNLSRAKIALAAFVGSLLVATLNLVSLPVAVLCGVLVVFVTGCITPEEAYREVEWKALILIGSMLGVGAALETTGAASYLAGLIADNLGHTSPIWLLTAFFGLTMLLTQPMSNQAAAVVVVPVAIQTALQLGLNPRTFAAMIAVAASCSFLTPLEPACLMVYGPGEYRFVDFLKVGSLLTLLVYFVAIFLVPMIWPL
jgi:di/tricarboxylate transporter